MIRSTCLFFLLVFVAPANSWAQNCQVSIVQPSTSSVSICAGDVVTLIVSYSIPNAPDTLSWSPTTFLDSTSQNTDNLRDTVNVFPNVTTVYTVTGTPCSSNSSDNITINVSPLTVGGTVSANQSICSGSQPADLTLSGHTGSVLRWQSDDNAGFSSPANIAVTSTTLTGAAIGPLTSTTFFRAVVKSGVCDSVNSSSVTIAVDPATVGGSVSSDQTICSGNQPNDLTLSGHTGSILRWESDDNSGFSSPTAIAVTAATLPGATIGALTATTFFRAVVKSGVCASANSTFVTVTVNPVSVGGTVSSDQTICSGNQPSSLTLTGHAGFVLRWESDDNSGFSSPTAIAVTSATLPGATIGILTATTFFRAVVQSGVCPSANSSSVQITVDPPASGGTVASDQTICSGSQPNALTLSGHSGSVIRWESDDNFSFTSPLTIAVTSTTLSGGVIGALTTTTFFRAVISSGTCTANSSIVTITVDPSTVGGNVASDQTLCSGSQPADLTLSGHTGTILRWELDDNSGFSSPTPIAVTAATLPGTTIGALTVTTFFRAVVVSGVCPSANSSFVTITVNPVTVGGTVTADQTICSGSQPADLALNGHTGSIIRWESDDNSGFSSPTSIAVTSATLSGATIGTLSATTFFRAVVKSGVCLTVNSSSVQITVDPVTIGGSIASDQTICNGSQPADLLLSGHTGTVLRWESDDNSSFNTPTVIAVTTATLAGTTIGPLSATTFFRAVVKSGVCPEANSASVTVTVEPATVGGSVSADQTICSGDLPASLVLSGQTGSILRWERDDNSAFSSPTLIAVTSSTLTGVSIGALTETAFFRAVVRSGVCPPANSTFVTITVNPVPVRVNSLPGELCSGNALNDTIRPSFSSNVTFSWTTPAVTGIFGNSSDLVSDGDSIIADVLINSTIDSAIYVPYSVILTYTENGFTCQSTSTDSVLVRPGAPTPELVSLTSADSLPPLTLCAGSEFISFNVLNPVPGITYTWSAFPGSGSVVISDDSAANTLISFFNTGNYSTAFVTVTAYNLGGALGNCPNDTAVIDTIAISGDTLSFQERAIILQNPGNLLIYLDNTADGYRWGCDDADDGEPHFIPDQVYQAFAPNDSFLVNDTLDILKYYFWVQVYKDGCYSKVFYNGPNRIHFRSVFEDIPTDITSAVYPNPGSGIFTLLLAGDIYGAVGLKLYNELGQVVFSDLLNKQRPSEKYQFDLGHLPRGMYLLDMISTTDERIVNRIIVN